GCAGAVPISSTRTTHLKEGATSAASPSPLGNIRHTESLRWVLALLEMGTEKRSEGTDAGAPVENGCVAPGACPSVSECAEPLIFPPHCCSLRSCSPAAPPPPRCPPPRRNR